MEYIFYGRVYPDHTYLQIEVPLHGMILFEEQEIHLSLHVYSSNINFFCTCEKYIEDVLTFRNYLLDFANNFLNVLCLLHGVMYRIEIISYVCTGDKSFIAFRHTYNVPEQEALINKYGNKFMDILFCTQTPVGFFVSDCLNNIKFSMSNPIDTGFYIYRCIENIRNSFMQEHNISEDKEKDGWKIMNDALGGNMDDVDWIRKNFSLPRRHGRGVLISGQERDRCISIGYGIVSLWIDYIIKKYEINTQTTTPFTLL